MELVGREWLGKDIGHAVIGQDVCKSNDLRSDGFTDSMIGDGVIFLLKHARR